MDKKTAKVIFQPSGRRGEVETGINLIEASRQLGVDIEALCGEKKVCGKCKVRIETGTFQKYGVTSGLEHVSDWQKEEDKFITPSERELGFRLACAAKVTGDLLVFVPEESRAGKQVVSKAARDIPIEWNPAVRLYSVTCQPPTFEEPTADFERVCTELAKDFDLKDLRADLFALRKLPTAIRKGKWTVTVAVWNGSEVINFWPGEVTDYYGIAVDIGTTTIAAYLCNLATMQVMDTVSMMNPQCKYGEDVMARITYHQMTPGGLERMSDDLIEGLNTLIKQACTNTFPPLVKKKDDNGKVVKDADGNPELVESPEEGVEYLRLEPGDIVDMTFGCNTAMHHIFLQLDPEPVGLAPFPPVVHHSLDLKARDLGLVINRGSYVFVLPNEAGFVGADNVCVLVAEEPQKYEEIALIIDIGTNGELVLGNKDKLISSSCATGPALEGAQLSCGMRAAPGAIERIKIDPDTHEVDYKVIGREAWKAFSEPKEMQTKGICGSGILDVLAELYASGVVAKSGRFAKEQKSERFRSNPDNPRQKEFVIAWANETSINKDVVITQKDIRQIQLGKGALYTGCKLMMRRMGIEKVDTVKIAGAFGTHVDKAKALAMGLFPDCDLDKVMSVGNAAGDGARAALLDVARREEADWIARNVEYIELTVEEDFEQQFMESMQLPHMTDEFPHLEGVVRPEILHQK
ncbi:MAG: ASKHA domain-containing protein [Desulfarculaceae bacterium]|nr:ASKHA domain-containing protein [Desulfarculaceae bacterium]MCF8072660.1 ASKHA domain-containing protein [Desulfarculaceae bacterium]MCF8102539.1 ASKHA domain-containing protein [Desulfarculaceae bacterium]MCF8116448.1 ASKHA domain-containing protein [Desulfarculaceae bacterium]